MESPSTFYLYQYYRVFIHSRLFLFNGIFLFLLYLISFLSCRINYSLDLTVSHPKNKLYFYVAFSFKFLLTPLMCRLRRFLGE